MCIFSRRENDNSRTDIAVHVDDIFVTAKDEQTLDKVLIELEYIYKGLSVQRGKMINYLGMRLDFSENEKVKITMQKYVDDLMEFCAEITGVASSPAKQDLFTVVEDELLDEKQREFFHSAVAKFLYLKSSLKNKQFNFLSIG